MNKPLIAGMALMLGFATLGHAQSDKRTDAWNHIKSKNYAAAQPLIDAVVEHPSTREDAKSWNYRAMVYSNLALDPKLADQRMEYFQTAFESARQSVEYDKKKQFLQANLGVIKVYLDTNLNRGNRHWDKQEYGKSAQHLARVQDAIDAVGGGKDTLLMLKIGVAYNHSGQPQKAEPYLKWVVDTRPSDALAYRELSDLYLQNKDTAKAMEVLESGMKHVSEKKELLISQMNVYLNKGQMDKVAEVGERAIELDPDNYTIYQALGTIYYTNLNNAEKAEHYFSKSIEIAPTSAEAQRSLGFFYFNQAVDKYNVAATSKDFKQQNALNEEAKALWSKSLAYLEKAHELEPKHAETLRVLKETTGQLSLMDKYKEYKTKLEALQQGN